MGFIIWFVGFLITIVSSGVYIQSKFFDGNIKTADGETKFGCFFVSVCWPLTWICLLLYSCFKLICFCTNELIKLGSNIRVPKPYCDWLGIKYDEEKKI